MTYSSAYYENERKISEYKNKLKNLKNDLEDLDYDYNTITKCKQNIALCSANFGDLLNQCDEINNVFDRTKMEAKYDSYQIHFNTRDMIFGYLDNIKISSGSLNDSCDSLKAKIDAFGDSLDGYCMEIAKDAEKKAEEIELVEGIINQLAAKRISLMVPVESQKKSQESNNKKSENKKTSSALTVYDLNP